VVGRMVVGCGMAAGLRSWRTASHRSRLKVSLCKHHYPACFPNVAAHVESAALTAFPFGAC
jgi:hypothetical protein